MSGVTSAMLDHINTFRNPLSNQTSPQTYKIALAEMAYIAIIPFALVEAAISQVLKTIAQFLPISDQSYQVIYTWATNSTDCVQWVMRAITINLFTKQILLRQHITTMGVRPYFNFSRFRTSRSLSFSPIKLPSPPTVEPAVAQLLNQYELGPHAKCYSNTLKNLYHDLPNPSAEELDKIGDQIADLLADRCTSGQIERIKIHLNSIGWQDNRNEWEDHYIKMVISIRKKIMETNDPSEIEIMKQGFTEAYENCSNRQSTEIERLFFAYAAPHLNSSYLNSLTPTDSLILEMMHYRMTLRDTIINSLCHDEHNAASHNYFQRKCNESVFYLPPSALSTMDLQYENFAMKDQEQNIIQAFRHVYESPSTIYTLFTSLINPQQGKASRFKAEMFSVAWLNSTGRMNAGAFEDLMMTKYKPQLIIEYLESFGFLKRKIG